MDLDHRETALARRLENDEAALITALNHVKRQAQMLAEQSEAINTLRSEYRAMASMIAVNARPFVGGGQVLPAVGTPPDFWDAAYAVDNPFYTGQDFFDRLLRDRLPLPDFANNEGYTPNGSVLPYWTFGLDDYLKAMNACSAAGVNVRRVFDFGGSTGRVFRHFYCQDEMREVWSCDFKEATVAWNLKHFPADIRLFLNTFLPHLPIQDGYFDLVTAYSVFTHIDELETAWLLELKRILRPGGVAYVTIHDDTTWRRMQTEAPMERLAAAVRRSPNGVTAEFTKPLPDGRAAYHFTAESHYNCNVFHSQEYIRKNWGRFFDVVEIRPTSHWEQAVVVCVNS